MLTVAEMGDPTQGENLMEHVHAIERRSVLSSSHDITATVRQGLLMQQKVGTTSAVEFLVARSIDGAVIRRVLNGRNLRDADREALFLSSQARV